MVFRSKKWILMVVLCGFCGTLLAQDWPSVSDLAELADKEIVVDGQGGCIFVNVSGPGESLPGLATGVPQGNGDGGAIRIRTGIDVDEGNGADGNLTESVTLEPGEYHYKYVGIPDGVLRPGMQPLTITVKGQVVIHCQHNFYARIEGDYSLGVPRLEVYTGKPQPIECQVDGRTIGYSEMPFLVAGGLSPKRTDPPGDGGTFIFDTEYEGDLKVFLLAVGGEGAQPGSIHIDARNGDVRGMAWAMAIPPDALNFDPACAGEIVISASSDGATPSEIMGQFVVSLEYGYNPMVPMSLPSLQMNPEGTIELNADQVTNLSDALYSFAFEYAPLANTHKEDLVRYLPERTLTAGVLITDIQATGGPSQAGGKIDIRTGMRVDVGSGTEAVTSDRTLSEGTYYFQYVDSLDRDEEVTLTVSGDVVIHCQYLFAANIEAAEGLSKMPDVVVYAGPPFVIEDNADPVALYLGQHPYLGPFHYANVNLTGAPPANPDDMDPGDIPVPGFPGQDNRIDSAGGSFTFHTTTFGSIDASRLDASAGGPDASDIMSMYGPAADGGEVVLLAQQGDIEVTSLHADAGGGMTENGHGGRVVMRGDNVFIYAGVSAIGAGMEGSGGQIYIEASDYHTGEAGAIYCADGLEPAIDAHGNGQTVYGIAISQGAGGDVTVVPDAVDPQAINVQGVPEGTLNEWIPDDLEELQYD